MEKRKSRLAGGGGPDACVPWLDFGEEEAAAVLVAAVESDLADLPVWCFEDDFAVIAGAVPLGLGAKSDVGDIVELERDFLQEFDVFPATIEATSDTAFFPTDVHDVLEVSIPVTHVLRGEIASGGDHRGR